MVVYPGATYHAPTPPPGTPNPYPLDYPKTGNSLSLKMLPSVPKLQPTYPFVCSSP